jgi:hypothetical protein
VTTFTLTATECSDNGSLRAVSRRHIADQHGNRWQYHSRSDRHSKVACRVVLFDASALWTLRRHAEMGKVAFGINHQMIDFRTDKRKDLDLVICEPLESEPDEEPGRWRSFAQLAEEYGVLLDDRKRWHSRRCRVRARPVGDAGPEAKAAMTHARAALRLSTNSPRPTPVSTARHNTRWPWDS